MKRKIACLALIASLGTLSWGSAQGTRPELYDTRKMQQEIEVMKGILGTTIGFFARDYKGKEGSAPKSAGQSSGMAPAQFYGQRFSLERVSGYYLYGQGVTFVVPLSALEGMVGGGSLGYGADFEEMEAALAGTAMEMEDAQAELERLGVQASVREAALRAHQEAAVLAAAAATGQVPPPPPPPPAAPTAPKAAKAPTPAPQAHGGVTFATKPAQNKDEIKKRLTEAKEKMKVRREEAEQRRKKLLDAVEQLKGYLIEALANHGDSLTQLKPGEYVNIVITNDEGHWGMDETSAERQVISVQKSWVTDYKAGRITLDAFKQKTLQYRS